jgi:hypothetical protein
LCFRFLHSGTYAQSFGSIAPAVTKRALLTDDGPRQMPRDHIGSPAGEPKIITAPATINVYTTLINMEFYLNFMGHPVHENDVIHALKFQLKVFS